MRYSATHLRRARANAGLTRQDLAQAIGRSTATVEDWETGRRRPTVVTLGALAETLHCGVESFYEYEPLDAA